MQVIEALLLDILLLEKSNRARVLEEIARVRTANLVEVIFLCFFYKFIHIRFLPAITS
tara:strand:- start:194 stop:367 length:174 start_codon:yes stop_codon:yes gene_type:complete